MPKLRTSDLKPIVEEAKTALEAGRAAEVLRVLTREEERFRAAECDIPRGDVFGSDFWLTRARALARLHRWDEAIAALGDLPDADELHDQTRAKGYVLRAEILARRGDVDRAIWDLWSASEVINLGAPRDEALRLLPVMYARKGAFARAAELAAAAKKPTDTSGGAALAEGEVRRLAGDAAGAEAIWRELAGKKKKASDDAREALVRLSLEHGRAHQAQALLAELAPAPADDVDRLLLEEAVLRAVGDTAAADEKGAAREAAAGPIPELAFDLADPLTALRAAPRDPGLHRALAEAALAAGDLKKADHWTGLLVELAPQAATSWVLRGRWLAAAERPEQALEAFARADPAHAPAHMGRAELLLRLGRREAARTALADAVQADAGVRRDAGRLLLTAGDAAGARFFLEPEAREHPGERAAEELFARCLLALGDPAGEATLVRLLAEAPDDELRKALVAHRLASARWADALALAEAGTSDVDRLDAIAALIGAARTDEAASRLDAWLDAPPRGALPRFTRLLAQAGAADAAEEWLGGALAEAPDDPELHLAMEALARERGQADDAAGWARSAEAYRLVRGGRAAEALSAFEDARRKEPGAFRHARGEARALRLLGKNSEAEKRIEAALAAIAEPDLATVVLYGDFCAEASRAREGTDAFLAGLARNPGDTRWLEALIAFLHRAKRSFEVRKYERQLAELKGGASAPEAAAAPADSGARPARVRPPRAVATRPAAPEKLRSLELLKRLDEGRAHEVMAEVEQGLAAGRAWDRDDRGLLVRLRALARLERWAEIPPVLQALAGVRVASNDQGEVLLAQLAWHEATSRDLEERLRLAKGALAGYVNPDVKPELHALLALGYAELGAGALSERFLAELDSGSTRRRHAYTRGRLLLGADDRLGARRAFAEAAEPPLRGIEPPTLRARAYIALAGTAALLGEDAEARAALAQATPLPDDVEARRAMAEVGAILDGPPAEDAPRQGTLLPRLPGVVQKRAYCGPASLELLLASFRQDVDQDAIAKVVTTRGGTPTWAMRELLGELGFAARRPRLPLARVKELLDRGVPVMLEESYANSLHVALAVGYDELSQRLDVRDPMRHGTRRTPYAEVEALRRACADAAIVAVPLAQAVRLDGIVDAPELLALERAERALAAGDPPGAQAALDEALALDAGLEPAWMLAVRLAELRLRRDGPGARPELERLVEEAARRFTASDWPLQARAQLCFWNGRPVDALAALQAALALDPNDLRSLYLAGRCHAALGELDLAERAFRHALWLAPGHAFANVSLARLLAERGATPEAWHRTEIALHALPHDPDGWLALGLLELAIGRPDDALQSFDRSLAEDPTTVAARIGRGRALLAMGRRDEARVALTAATSSETPALSVLREVAAAWLEAGEPQLAFDLLADALDEATVPPAVLALAGTAATRLGRHEQAVALLARALAALPDDAAVRVTLTRAHLALGHGEDALALARDGRARHPEVEAHAQDEATALLALDRVDEALAGMRELIARAPRAELIVALAAELLSAGRRVEARALCEAPIDRSLDLDRADIPLMLAYEKLLADHGEPERAHLWSRTELGWRSLGTPEAIAVFDELAAREPSEVRHRLGRWRALEAVGRGSEALREAEAAARATDLTDHRLIRWHSLIALRTNLLSFHWCDLWNAAEQQHPDDLAQCEAYLQTCLDFRERLEPFIDGLERRRYELRRKQGLIPA